MGARGFWKLKGGFWGLGVGDRFFSIFEQKRANGVDETKKQKKGANGVNETTEKKMTECFA